MLRKDDGFMVKEKIQKAKKPKYNTLQNVGWMVKIAWKNGKRVLLFCVLTAILEVLFNLVQLYIAGVLTANEAVERLRYNQVNNHTEEVFFFVIVYLIKYSAKQ